jgi:putative DNA modification/repair radical SAM protein
MDLKTKLSILADAAKYDASCSSSGGKRKTPEGGLGNSEGMGICHSYAPDGRCISLLKILFTNICIFDCRYCVNRVSSDTPRARFTVQEVVDLTLDFYKRNYIEGLFLSSGVIESPDSTMQQLTQVAKILRSEHKFGGYIHLKAVAGCSNELVAQAGRWADRVSANIELPTDADMKKLAPAKSHLEVEHAMAFLKSGIEASKEKSFRRDAPVFAPAGQSTQMIVGATASTDGQILAKADELYNRYRLKRVYYSAFSPIPHSDPTLPITAAPLVRENRLYQADWLLRFYGYKLGELVPPGGNLSAEMDPKLEWALRNRGFFPVDVNSAPREALLRVPGIGVKCTTKIIEARRFVKLGLKNLSVLRVALKRARAFIIATDHVPRPSELDSLTLGRRVVAAEQLKLSFDTAI